MKRIKFAEALMEHIFIKFGASGVGQARDAMGWITGRLNELINHGELPTYQEILDISKLFEVSTNYWTGLLDNEKAYEEEGPSKALDDKIFEWSKDQAILHNKTLLDSLEKSGDGRLSDKGSTSKPLPGGFSLEVLDIKNKELGEKSLELHKWKDEYIHIQDEKINEFKDIIQHLEAKLSKQNKLLKFEDRIIRLKDALVKEFTEPEATTFGEGFYKKRLDFVDELNDLT